MLRSTAAFIQSMIDIVLPRAERIMRIDDYRPEDLPIAPTEHDMCGAQIMTLMRYCDPVAEDLIRALKYNQSRHAARLLADTLAEFLREEIANIRTFSTHDVVLIPVPLHHTRRRERGFNQIELVLEHLPDEFHNGTLSHVISHALIRIRATQPQTHLMRAARLRNLCGAFAIVDAHTINGAHVILIDDVATTGATLSEAARPFGTTPTLIALAHA